jgi:hypothetical protein
MMTGQGAVAQDRPVEGSPASGLRLAIAAIGRIGRWAFYGVALTAIPILISLMFLSGNTAPNSVLSHGDFTVLAAAISGAAMGELLGPDEPAKWLRNLLVTTCCSLLIVAILLLSDIAHVSSLSPEQLNPHPWWYLSAKQDVNYSWWLFIASIVTGAAAMGATVHPPTIVKKKRPKSSSDPNAADTKDGKS